MYTRDVKLLFPSNSIKKFTLWIFTLYVTILTSFQENDPYIYAHIHMHRHIPTIHLATHAHTHTSPTPPCKHVYTIPNHAQPSHCPLLWPHASQLVLLTVPLSCAMSLWQNHSNRCYSNGCHSKWMLVFASSEVILTSLAGTGKHDPEKRNSPTLSAWSLSVIFLLARSHS